MNDATQFVLCVLVLIVIVGVSVWWGFYRSSGEKAK
jgi:hypothetical protein